MATYTSYYNLTKPEGTERVNIGIINQNMDAIDTQMHKNAQSIIANHGGMAIPSNNNTHAAVSSGQYVYVYNHSSLAEGLYIAKSSISTNGALSLSNLTAVSNGGLNHVYSTLNSIFATQQITAYGLSVKVARVFNIIIISVDGTASSDIAQWTAIGTLNTEFRPTAGLRDFTVASLRVNVNGIINNPTAISNRARVSGYCVYADS